MYVIRIRVLQHIMYKSSVGKILSLTISVIIITNFGRYISEDEH